MAWAFVGVSNVVEVTATSHPLVTTGIAGTLQAGDLLVACISSRIGSTTSVTLPVGWTLVSEQKNNNVLSTGSAAPSGLMAYCVRGASNPALTFTHPVAPSVAIGRIVAYRDVNTSSPKDTQTGFTTAISITAVSGTGLTTTEANDLIVAMAAGGQEAAWSSFNATSPAGASGATSAAAPTTTWLERADSLTTTGVDTSLAIFDAIKATAGATGNLTATASVAAAHVVIAGAFKIVAPLIDAWNVNDKSASITLSGVDKTATGTAASSSVGVRSTQARVNSSAGKYYAEFLFNTAAIAAGIAPTSLLLGSTASSFVVQGSTGNILVNSAGVGNVGAASINDIISVAWNSGAELVWFRRNAGNWNNSGTADPATGVGGIDCSFAAATDHCLYFRGFNLNDSVTLRTEVAEFSYTGPSGFTSWMGEALPTPSITGTGALVAESAAVAGAGEAVVSDITGTGALAAQSSDADGAGTIAGIPDAWNAFDKSANVTLSAGDKTATLASSVAGGVRSSTPHTNGTAGKYYAEFLAGASTPGRLGISPTLNTLTSVTATFGVACSSGDIYRNSSSEVLANIEPVVGDDILSIAWDTGAETFWFRRNEGDWNDNASADPATGAGGLDCSFAASTDHALWMQSAIAGSQATLRTEVAEFSYTGPSGFTSWMGEALPTPSITGTGALVAESAAVAGAGEAVVSDITGTGALAAQAADADGAGTISGALDAWNSADKSANITLSNSDKTATLSAAVTSGVRSTTKYLNGTETNKFYVEFLLTNVVGTISNQVGLREVSAALNGSAGSTFQCASNSGNILTGNATIIGNIGGSPLADNDVVCMAWSPSTERGWFRKNNGLWNNDAAADPATNTNGLNISVLNNTDHALFFLIASTGNGASTAIRTEAADLSYSAPSGFVSWMGEALSTPEATGTGALASQLSAVAGAGLSASTGDGAANAQVATVAGAGAVASSGTGALPSDAATVGGTGVSSSTGTGNAVAEPAAVAGTGSAAAANSGALVAQDAAVAGEGVSSSDGVGALQVGSASIAGAGLSVSVGIGALACSPVTGAGVGIVLEEGVAVGSGELLAGAATISGEGEVTGEVAVPPIYGGYHYRPDRRPEPVEGYGYGILPQIEGDAHGSVGAAGRSVGTLPRLAGLADAAVGAAGSSSARLTVKATAIGNAVTRGRGSGMIVKFEGAAAGRHDDDEAAVVAWLSAA